MQEGLEFGREEGRQVQQHRILLDKLRLIPKLAARKIPTEEIAELLNMPVKQVRTSEVPNGYLGFFRNTEAAREAKELGYEQGRNEAMEEEVPAEFARKMSLRIIAGKSAGSFPMIHAVLRVRTLHARIGAKWLYASSVAELSDSAESRLMRSPTPEL